MEIIGKFQPFKATGDDFSSSNPIFAYYFYKYYGACIVPIYNDCKDQSDKTELQAEIKNIQQKMLKIQQQGNLGSDEVHMKEMLEYTELMFAKNDHYHQEGYTTKQIAEDYLTIFRLYEVIGKFGHLDDGQNKRRVYSKKKFIDIMKAIKANPAIENQGPNKTQPPHQPPQNQSQAPNQSMKPPKPPIDLPPPVFNKPEEKKIQKIEQQIKKSGFKPLPKPSKLISFDKVQMQIQASKCLQNAVSELSFDRFKYAREQAMRALQLLDQIIDS